MWINNNISKPLREGRYKTLVDADGLGNLEEGDNEYFDGKSWSFYESNAQFISYWWAEKEDYKIITDRIEAEIKQIEAGTYILDKIKTNISYVILQEQGKEPTIEENGN